MRRFLTLSICIAAALGSAAPALAITSSGPVRIAACTVFSRQSHGGVLTPGLDLTNGVQVTLVNDSTKTTSAITVTGGYHGRSVTDSADVVLKPGASVTFSRSYYPPSTYVDANAQCRVVKVTFSDGTTWTSP
jgi:hypothetical protein